MGVRAWRAWRGPARQRARPRGRGAAYATRVRTAAAATPAPAAPAGDADAEEDAPSRAGVGAILRYALPSVAVATGAPANTMIDSLAVGLASTTSDLAALGANGAVFNFITYALTGLSMSTLSLVGAEREKGGTAVAADAEPVAKLGAEGDGSGAARRPLSQRSGQIVCVALLFALFLGAAATVSLWCLGERVLLLDDPDALARAASYLHVRAVSLPAVLLTMVANSALFAQKDSVTPARAVAASCALNAAGNALNAFLFKQGVAGTAWATVVAEVAVAAIMLRALARSGAYALPVGGVADDGGEWKAPSLGTFARFGASAAPLCAMYVLKNLCYLIIQSAGVCLGVVKTAAHQAVWAVWALWCVCATTSLPFPASAMPARGASHERAFTFWLHADSGVLAREAPSAPRHSSTRSSPSFRARAATRASARACCARSSGYPRASA